MSTHTPSNEPARDGSLARKRGRLPIPQTEAIPDGSLTLELCTQHDCLPLADKHFPIPHPSQE